MDYKNEMRIWDSAIVHIADVKHFVLKNQEMNYYHESSALIYVLGDNGKLGFDDFSYQVRSNCLAHIGPDTQIALGCEGGELDCFILLYHAELSPNLGRKLLSETHINKVFQRNYVIRPSSSPGLTENFKVISEEWNGLSPLSMLNIKRCFYSIIYMLYSDIASGHAAEPKQDLFAYANQYFQKHYMEPISIQNLADYLSISRSTLHKLFRDRTGTSPQQYLMELRLDAVRRTLETSSISVDEIAASCGLRDKSYLTRVFKEKYGTTPGLYRQSHSDRMVEQNGISTKRAGMKVEESEGRYLLIENMGRIHRFFDTPQRVVCLDYSTAEICAALGVADRITGVASAEESLADCAREYQQMIAKAPFLASYSRELNVPSFRSVCDCKPDIVIGTGYSFNRYGGVADAEEFEAEGIHIYAMNATYTLSCSFESVYDDIRNLGRIFDRKSRADELIDMLIDEEKELKRKKRNYRRTVRVFSYDSSAADKAITCGQSIEKHIIESAGGINVFGKREGQFVAVDWDEVGEENPDIILVHSFFNRRDGLKKIDYLKQIPEIKNTNAVRNNRLHAIGIKKIFPGIGNIETASGLLDIFHG